jgi:hypothetical protein
LGTLLSFTFPGISRAAAIRGRAAFLLHQIVTLQERFFEPCTWNIFMFLGIIAYIIVSSKKKTKESRV